MRQKETSNLHEEPVINTVFSNSIINAIDHRKNTLYQALFGIFMKDWVDGTEKTSIRWYRW